MTWTTPRTWAPGELVTATQMNTHLRDNLNSLRSESFGTQRFRGLTLRTHPDSDKHNDRVWFTADEVVMDDSTRLVISTPLAPSLAVSGAGGLDTGAEVISTWYEVYAIAKDDGTQSSLLHAGKSWAPDQQFTTVDTGRLLRIATATATDKIAQSTILSGTGPVPFVDLLLARANTPSGNIWVTLEADSAGSPSGTPLATSDKIDASLVSTAYQAIRFVFRTMYTAMFGTTYWIVLQGDYTRSDATNINWGGAVAGGYAPGSSKEYNGTSWSSTAGASGLDRYFRLWRETTTAVTMPSGYTKKCKVGHVFNESTGNLRPFEARDGLVHHNFIAFTAPVAATIPTLVDINSYVPATPVDALFGLSGDTATDQWTLSPAPTGYDRNLGYIYWAVETGSINILHAQAATPTDLQAIYYQRLSGAGNATFYIWGFRWS